MPPENYEFRINGVAIAAPAIEVGDVVPDIIFRGARGQAIIHEYNRDYARVAR